MGDKVRPGSIEKNLLFHLLIVLLLLAAFLPASAAGETIGVIMPGDIPYYREIHAAFVSRLNKSGLGEGVEIIVQRPYADSISLSNAARKLIALDVDVIVTYGAPATFAATGEKSKIPIVYASVYDPLVQRIRSKVVTGVSSKASPSSLLRYLKGCATLSTLGVIYSAGEQDSVYQMRELLKLSEQYGFRVEAIDLKRHQEAKTVLAGRKLDAIFVTSSTIANMASSPIADFAREQRIPTASLLPDMTGHVTITLSANPKDQGERTAEIMKRLLDGAQPENIRADSQGTVDLVFNLKEAQRMGFRIPMELVTEATRLVQ